MPHRGLQGLAGLGWLGLQDAGERGLLLAEPRGLGCLLWRAGLGEGPLESGVHFRLLVLSSVVL